MTSAMRSLTWWNPYAMRMATLILLSDASSLALEYPSWMVLRMSGRRLLIFSTSSTISGMRLWDARNTQWSGLALGLFDRVPEQRPEEFLDPPRAVELSRGVGVPDRVERLLLPVGQVLRVLQHGVPDAAQALRLLPVTVAPGLVPQSFPDLVERVAHPRDDVEPVQYAPGVRTPLAHARVDPAGASERARARAHADLEDGSGAQRRFHDARVLDHEAVDVEESFEYAVRRALFGCCFSWSMNILPGKRSSLTPTTAQRRTHTHENSRRATSRYGESWETRRGKSPPPTVGGSIGSAPSWMRADRGAGVQGRSRLHRRTGHPGRGRRCGTQHAER